MNKKYSSVEELYMEMAISELVKKAQEASVSEYTKTQYSLCRHLLGSMSLQEFAAYTSNYNPNKSGIGEKSQFQWLKDNKFPTLEKLPARGKNALYLHKLPNGRYEIVQGKKSNLNGVKSFDAYDSLANEIKLLFLKTIDIGLLTDSTGGGHQANVHDEVINLISHARQQKLSFAGKAVKIYIVVDGRSAATIINAGQNAANGSPDIIINESIKL